MAPPPRRPLPLTRNLYAIYNKEARFVGSKMEQYCTFALKQRLMRERYEIVTIALSLCSSGACNHAEHNLSPAGLQLAAVQHATLHLQLATCNLAACSRLAALRPAAMQPAACNPARLGLALCNLTPCNLATSSLAACSWPPAAESAALAGGLKFRPPSSLKETRAATPSGHD